MISEPPAPGKNGKGHSIIDLKDYETCSEEEVGEKPCKTRPTTPSSILKDLMDIVEDVSLTPLVLGSKRKKGLKEGRKNKLALRFEFPT